MFEMESRLRSTVATARSEVGVSALQARAAQFQAALADAAAIGFAFENLQIAAALFDEDERLVCLNAAYRDLLAISDLGSGLRPTRTELINASVIYSADSAQRRDLGQAYLNLPAAAKLDQVLPEGRMLRLSRVCLPGIGSLDTLIDVTDERAALIAAQHDGRHDALTGLPNRLVLAEKLAEALAMAQRGELAAVVCLDLDRFKAVNDTLGHAIGDLLLQEVARRLQLQLRETDSAIRLGGDEFALLHRRLQRPDEALSIAHRIVSDLSRPYLISGKVVVIGACAGIEVIDGGQTDPDQLLAHADIALYRAKAAGRGQVRFFVPEMQTELNARRELEFDLKEALLHRRLLLHYQPQLDMGSGRIMGLEALVRWPHPQHGLLSPDRFIALAEQSGLMSELGGQILDMACAEAAGWPSGVRVCVNISAAQFLDGAILDQVRSALSSSQLSPARLELEIAETLILAGGDQALRILQALKAMGVRIALDNLSLGPSFISYATRGVFDGVKIDSSWMPAVSDGSGGVDVVAAFAAFCRTLGLTAALSNVDAGLGAELVSLSACDSVQGFAFARPVPANEVGELFKAPTLSLRGPARP